jgi:hypothetical protein
MYRYPKLPHEVTEISPHSSVVKIENARSGSRLLLEQQHQERDNWILNVNMLKSPLTAARLRILQRDNT